MNCVKSHALYLQAPQTIHVHSKCVRRAAPEDEERIRTVHHKADQTSAGEKTLHTRLHSRHVQMDSGARLQQDMLTKDEQDMLDGLFSEESETQVAFGYGDYSDGAFSETENEEDGEDGVIDDAFNKELEELRKQLELNDTIQKEQVEACDTPCSVLEEQRPEVSTEQTVPRRVAAPTSSLFKASNKQKHREGCTEGISVTASSILAKMRMPSVDESCVVAMRISEPPLLKKCMSDDDAHAMKSSKERRQPQDAKSMTRRESTQKDRMERQIHPDTTDCSIRHKERNLWSIDRQLRWAKNRVMQGRHMTAILEQRLNLLTTDMSKESDVLIRKAAMQSLHQTDTKKLVTGTAALWSLVAAQEAFYRNNKGGWVVSDVTAKRAWTFHNLEKAYEAFKSTTTCLTEPTSNPCSKYSTTPVSRRVCSHQLGSDEEKKKKILCFHNLLCDAGDQGTNRCLEPTHF